MAETQKVDTQYTTVNFCPYPRVWKMINGKEYCVNPNGTIVGLRDKGMVTRRPMLPVNAISAAHVVASPIRTNTFSNFDFAGKTSNGNEYSNCCMNGDYSNAGGYGFWCGKKCAAEKDAKGVPVLGSAKGANQDLKESQAELNKATAAALLQNPSTTPDTGGSNAGLIIGLTVGGILVAGIITIVVVRSMKAKKLAAAVK